MKRCITTTHIQLMNAIVQSALSPNPLSSFWNVGQKLTCASRTRSHDDRGSKLYPRLRESVAGNKSRDLDKCTYRGISGNAATLPPRGARAHTQRHKCLKCHRSSSERGREGDAKKCLIWMSRPSSAQSLGTLTFFSGTSINKKNLCWGK